VGLGPARNAGLDAATGEYVWFVDSDDWLEPGSVGAVVAALEASSPDLLLLDHDRVYDATGAVELDHNSELLRGVPADQVFNLDERPALLRVQHTAWSRVFRRAYLAEQGLRFPPGWYEDFALIHPAVLAARRISVLDRVCYHYRQRDGGAITKTPSPRVFEVFDQYDRMQATLDRMASAGAPAARTVRRFRPDVFQLMIAHHMVILGNEGRVPPSLRREYFRRTVAQYRRYRPEGYTGATGLRQRLVAANAYPAWAGLRWAYRSAKGLRRAVSGRVA
jgi:glycosyltransferase involved in cell wall biosynthesis